MAQPKTTDATQFLQFMKEDATMVWIRRDAIIYFYKDSVSYKTTLKLITGECFVVSEKVDDVQGKCSIGN